MKNNGKPTEKIFDNLYNARASVQLEFMFYKFVDSSAARNMIQAQPADRMIMHKGHMWLVEIKSSMDPVRFPLKNISKKQIGYGKRWQGAGASSIFIIHRIETDEFFFVPLSEVLDKLKSKSASWHWSELEPFKNEAAYDFWQYYDKV